MKNKTTTTGLSSIKAKLKARAKIDSNTANQDGSMTNNSASKANLYGEETFKTTDLIDKPIIFAEAIGQVKPLINDTVKLISKSHKTNREQKNGQATTTSNKAIAQFHFSDEFEPNLNKQGPVKYVRDGVNSFEVKNLRRGHYQPDLILDLHGLDQHQAKKELAALIFACQKEHAQCVCIVHGIGAGVLKNKVPHWLVQHPDIMAFHQAPLQWGGAGAILALIELKDKYDRG
jgi:DNA-nicking Smr family endonuclease